MRFELSSSVETDLEDARLAVAGQYVILFSIEDDVVRIERVVFGARDLPSLLS